MNEGLKHLTPGSGDEYRKSLQDAPSTSNRQLDRAAGEKRKQNVVGEQQIPMKTRLGISNKKT